MGKRHIFAFVFMALLLAAAASAQTTVTLVGANDPALDVPAIQAAVNVPDRTVYLDGTFNFGTTGQVLIHVPNITLEGVSTGATIKGGMLPITTLAPPYIPPSTAKNVTIRNIHFEGWTLWAIYHAGVTAEDNFTLIEGNTFTNTRWPTPGPPYYQSLGIHYGSGGGSVEIKGNTFINIAAMAIATHAPTLLPKDHLLISGNKIMNCHADAIAAEGWNVLNGEPENGPVTIEHNEINMGPDVALFCWPITVGTLNVGPGDHGLSNAVVEGNILTGYASSGITANCYGHNRKIINNDLSGLTTWGMQVSTWGRDDLIANNILGPMDTEKAALMGVPYLAAGVVMWSANPNPGVLPDTLPVTNNISMDNDFRLTGLKGWAYDAASNFTSSGCVLLATTGDFGWNVPWPGIGVIDNLIKETGRFPRGTGGPKQQVLEFPVYAYHNRIVGHAADEYAQLEAANPGIGQKIKESGVKFMEMLQNKLALNKQLLEETEGH